MKIKKHLSFLLLSAALLIPVLSFSQDRAVMLKNLPEKAQNFISKHFKGLTTSREKTDKEGYVTYETHLIQNGNDLNIIFDAQGNWRQIDCPAGIPSDMVPKRIAHHILANYNGKDITRINQKTNSYDILLSNGTKLEFDSFGDILK